MRVSVVIWASCWLLVGTGCAASGPAVASAKSLRGVYYRAAVMPVYVPEPRRLAGDDDEGLEVTIDADKLTDELALALEQFCFTETVRLKSPTVQESSKLVSRPAERAYFMDRALNPGEADVAIECRLEYERVATHRTNSSAWTSGLLFLVGGPFVWWNDDRDYEIDARLEVKVHDLSLLRASGEPVVILQDVVELETVEMDFGSRADGITDRLVSLVWPATFLSTETEAARENLERRVIDHFRNRVVALMQDRRDQLHANRSMAWSIAFDERPSARRNPDGTVSLEAAVEIAKEDLAFDTDNISAYHAGRQLVSEGLEVSEVGTANARRQRIHGLLEEVPLDAESVQVRVREPGLSGALQTWTFAIDSSGSRETGARR